MGVATATPLLLNRLATPSNDPRRLLLSLLVKLSVRSRVPDGLILLLSDAKQMDFVVLKLTGGKLALSADLGKGPASITSPVTSSDGQWHTVGPPRVQKRVGGAALLSCDWSVSGERRGQPPLALIGCRRFKVRLGVNQREPAGRGEAPVPGRTAARTRQQEDQCRSPAPASANHSSVLVQSGQPASCVCSCSVASVAGQQRFAGLRALCPPQRRRVGSVQTSLAAQRHFLFHQRPGGQLLQRQRLRHLQ